MKSPQQVKPPLSSKNKIAVQKLLALAQRLQEQGNLAGALEAYREAQALTPKAQAQVFDVIIEILEEKLRGDLSAERSALPISKPKVSPKTPIRRRSEKEGKHRERPPKGSRIATTLFEQVKKRWQFALTIILSLGIILTLGSPLLRKMQGIGRTQVSLMDGMVMVYVPAGKFTLGSEIGGADEKPVHTVFLGAFWIDKTEVTNAMYAICVQANACQPPSNYSSETHNYYYGNPQYDNFPVINVSWFDVQTYCTWAERHLSSEAEWEKAARGTDDRVYQWGNKAPVVSMLNFNTNVGDTTAVGSYPIGASPYGALDLSGNVWEWVSDWYRADYYFWSPQDSPTGPSSGEYRVLRGGSWKSGEGDVRATNRNWNEPAYSSNDVGFRCALGISP